MNEPTNRREQLEANLLAFRLPSFKKQYQSIARQAEKERLDHVAYLFELSRLEAEDRYHRRTERLIRDAKLPTGKQLEQFDYANVPSLSPSTVAELSSGSCLDSCENILVFGNPGTGKTHLAIALGREWCLRGRSVYFTTAAALVQILLAAKRDLTLNAVLKKFDRVEALIIDDLSYIPQDREETDVLFVLLAERYERRSVVVTSNLAFSDWNKIFKDPMTTMAAIDRLVHHARILELNGPSYRVTAATRKKNGKTKDQPTSDN